MSDNPIRDLAEKVFGIVCYAGFDSVLWAVEDDRHLCRYTLNAFNEMNRYKWSILDKAMKMRPDVLDLHQMAQVIMFITDGNVVYNDEELDKYQELLDSLVP